MSRRWQEANTKKSTCRPVVEETNERASGRRTTVENCCNDVDDKVAVADVKDGGDDAGFMVTFAI